jgi:glycosyltransferase involved in cell wall biosynthesis
MKNVLFVSVAFPPKSDSEGLQVAKYLKYLIREGADSFHLDAVTSALPTLNMPYDASLEPMRQGVRQVIEIPIYENRYSNFLIRNILPWAATIPDPKFTFHLQSRRVGSELRAKPDLIYSRAFPLSSAMMAYHLKRRYGVPWVMHLSDLWVDCPERKYSGVSRALQERLERTCFEAADVVCVTSEKTRSFYSNKYRHLGRRIEYFPNVFDPEDAVSAGDEARRMGGAEANIRIVYTGSLVGSRSATPFLKALSQLDPDIQDRLEVILVGPVDLANSMAVQKWRLPYVHLRGPVGYQESLEIQRSADLLVLIDLPVENPALRVYFPSKLLDYLLSRRPILAITDEGSEIERVIRDQGVGTCIHRNNTQELVRYLTSFARTSSRERHLSVPRTQEIYSARYNAQRLVRLFGELTRGGSGETSHIDRVRIGAAEVASET